MKRFNFIASKIVLFFFLNGCLSKKNTKNGNQKYFDLPKYFLKEISVLKKINPEIQKNTTQNEDVESMNQKDVNWTEELVLFQNFDLNNINQNKLGFENWIDSNGPIAMQIFENKDTTAELKKVRITQRNNKIELIEIETEKHSFWVDRKLILSYQPEKGYGIISEEDYAWSKPTKKEISVSINNDKYLRH